MNKLNKIWSWVAMFFMGLSAGLMIAVKTAGDTYAPVAYIKKVKQKAKKGASQLVDFDPIVSAIKNDETLSKLKQRRALRKEKRKLRTNESNTNSVAPTTDESTD